ncbi:MAG: DNA mismatch repair protein MutS [Tissierellia bacterium]|nr:DNA mismatch repair protein MutS [Tissierellia bacterium]
MIETALVFSILFGIILGIQIHYGLFSVSVISLIALLLYDKRRKMKHAEFIKKDIKEQWGKKDIEKRDFSQIDKLYKYLLEEREPEFYIDDITWRDLNMDTVFLQIDRTKSLPGMQFLYNMLRNPLFNKDKIKDRNQTSELLLENDELARDIQYPLHILGKKQGKKIFDFFYNGLSVDTSPLWYLTIFSYLPFLVIVLFFFNQQMAFLFLMFSISINAYFYQHIKKKIYAEIDTFKYLGNLIECAKSIVKLDLKNIDLKQDELNDLLDIIKKTGKNISKINFNDGFEIMPDTEVIMHYYNMFFLKEPKIFYKAVKSINQYKDEFEKMYKIVGEIDANISIASYKSGLDYYTEPEFVFTENKFYLQTKHIYHPLLDEPIPYSIQLANKGALVTGSNASGKSTFLRTIGINTLFAQTMGFVLAQEYTTSFFKLLTSIGTVDSIVEGDSYFMAEAKSLLRVLDELDPKQPVLCILDEIFRGTNTAERISAASESLEYMSHKNCCVIAATHDLELTSMVDDNYNNYHFKETISQNDITFDYILREGPCTSRNGIAILKYLGYPKELHEEAERKAAGFLLA